MKKAFILHFLTAILATGLSCREHNSRAKTPSDTEQMEGVRESKEDAMEKAKERTGKDQSRIKEDSMSKKESTTGKSLDGNKN